MRLFFQVSSLLLLYQSSISVEAQKVATGDMVSCAHTSSLVQCWGDGSATGDGISYSLNTATSTTKIPTTLSFPAAVGFPQNQLVQVTCGGDGAGHNQCAAVFTSGVAVAWGSNPSGQLGDGSYVDIPLSLVASVITTSTILASKVVIRRNGACLLSTAGTVFCWGTNNHGELGVGDTVSYLSVSQTRAITFASPTILATDLALGTGSFYHMCAMFSNGRARCWGLGSDTVTVFGNLGLDNARTAVGSLPSDMSSLAFISFSDTALVTQLAVGDYHSCAVFSGGRCRCWGYGGEGQLGNGAMTNQMGVSAGQVGSLDYIAFGTTDTAKSIGAGSWYTCVLFVNGGVRCFGNNQYGVLGLDSSVTRFVSPMTSLGFVVFSDTLKAVQLAVGYHHSCVVFSTNRVRCWGYNNGGQLGSDNTLQYGSSPTLTVSMSPFVNILPCIKGTASGTGFVPCSPCGPGTASSLDRSNGCTTCVAPHYSTGTANTACSSCPAGSFCAVNDAAPVTCAAGSTSGADQTACTACPSGSACPTAKASASPSAKSNSVAVAIAAGSTTAFVILLLIIFCVYRVVKAVGAPPPAFGPAFDEGKSDPDGISTAISQIPSLLPDASRASPTTGPASMHEILKPRQGETPHQLPGRLPVSSVPIPGPVASVSSTQEYLYDCFLTHDWGQDELNRNNHARVAILNEGLKEKGVVTWFDSERLTGNIDHEMTWGIDKAVCVVVAVTQRYMLKVNGPDSRDNCQTEFLYAARRKGPSRMIPVVMEDRMRDTNQWRGPLGSKLGSLLYVELMKDGPDFDAGVSQLAQKIFAIKRQIKSGDPNG